MDRVADVLRHRPHTLAQAGHHRRRAPVQRAVDPHPVAEVAPQPQRPPEPTPVARHAPRPSRQTRLLATQRPVEAFQVRRVDVVPIPRATTRPLIAFSLPNNARARTLTTLPDASRTLSTTPASSPEGGFTPGFFRRPCRRLRRRCRTSPKTCSSAAGYGRWLSTSSSGGEPPGGTHSATAATSSAAVARSRGPTRRSIRNRLTTARAA